MESRIEDYIFKSERLITLRLKKVEAILQLVVFMPKEGKMGAEEFYDELQKTFEKVSRNDHVTVCNDLIKGWEIQ